MYLLLSGLAISTLSIFINDPKWAIFGLFLGSVWMHGCLDHYQETEKIGVSKAVLSNCARLISVMAAFATLFMSNKLS
jgi:glucose uptake protein GlcU